MTTDTAFTPLTGSCRCGQARFRLEAAPIITHCCHCRLCQQGTGTAFRHCTMIETRYITLVAGRTRSFQGVNNHQEVQCPDCGCALWLHRRDLGEVIALVGVGLLDQGERLSPEAHFFTRSKQPWIVLPPGVPAFETRGDPGKASARERIVAALASVGQVPEFPAGAEA